MTSVVRLLPHRSATSSLPPGGRRRFVWLGSALAIVVFGAACATPAPDAPPPAPPASSATETGGIGSAESARGPDAQPAAADPVGVAPSDAAPGGADGSAAASSLVSGALDVPASGADGHGVGTSAHAAEIEPGASAADVPLPSAPFVPGGPVAGPPVVIPAVPAPPGLVQAPACEPLPGPRAGSWREPLPPTPRYNPEGPKRVALQAGHWLTEQVPTELRGLQHGATGGGKMEWEVNLDIARRTKALLEAQGVVVDILPTTVPVRYRAHLFVSIHADGDTTGRTSGFKIARPAFSSLPAVDDRLVESLYAAYGAATGLRRDDANITPRMRYYYAFNARRFCHAVAPGVPQAILETGFLTNAADRQLLLGRPDVVARGIADGILRFLNEHP